MLDAAARRFASPRRTVRDTVTLLSLRRYRRFLYVSAAAYLAVYLVAIGDVTLGGSWGLTVTDPSLALNRRASASFEPVAAVSSPYVTALLSPVNIAVGGVLSALVGANLAFSYYTWRNPDSCGTTNASGLLSSVPALLAGTACCAPVVLLVLGIQASAALLAFFRFSLPLSVLLLLVSLAYVVAEADIDAHTEF